MIEVGAFESSEETVVSALEKASEEIEKLNAFQLQIQKEIGKTKKEMPKPKVPSEVGALFEESIAAKFPSAVFSGVAGKKPMYELKNEWLALAKEKLSDNAKPFADEYFEDQVNDSLHKEAIEKSRRPDNRKLDELRPLFAQAGGLSSVLHGSGIFYRGGTHVFSALTLGGPGDSQLIDSMETKDSLKRFIHHYNFPPFSSGETGRLGGLNRRMVGHGALAEKSLAAVIPPKETFPYTIRLVSECLASNGSTSMGSVCASTLALMDGGVPITAPVAGIAMGLMMEESGIRNQESTSGKRELKYKILTDIQGPEDHHGDMDFKVAGTKKGITGIQLDVKVDGVAIPILAEALRQARAARLQILEVIEKAIPAPRSNISPNAPEIRTLAIKPDQIGMVIGPGGKVINGIKEATGVDEITIEDDGTVFVTGKNGTAEKAVEIIRDMTREYMPGERFEGEVTRILDFGAFVKIGASAEGMVHISEIAPFRIDRVEDAVSLGEKVPVIIKEIDEKKRINLSIKGADPEFAARKGVQPGTGQVRLASRPPRRDFRR